VNTTNATTDWKEIRCACMRVNDLHVLAEVRERNEIRVFIAGDRAWVRWQANSDTVHEILARWILPLEGVELFTERGGRWYRLGEHLPVLSVPFHDGEDGVGLDRVLIPGKLSAQRPSGPLPDSLRVGLVPDERPRNRPATAMRCSLQVLSVWAEHATSLQLSRLQGAWRQAAAGEQLEAEAFVRGAPGKLPHLGEGVRYWGTDLLIPLGFRVDPELPEQAIRAVVGAGEADLVVLDEHGIELIPRDAFEPLLRAGIRLARGDVRGVGGWEDR
jgi:hypothetical protein